MTAPVWPFKPDWNNPITETLQFLTAIQMSRSGAEQRQALRQTPRRMIDYAVQLYGNERAYFDAWMMRFGAGPCYVPLAHEQAAVIRMDSGDVFIPMDTSFMHFGSKVVIHDLRRMTAEVQEVTSVVADGVNCTPLENDYPQGGFVYPGILAQITDDVNVSRRSGSVYEGTVRFLGLEAQYHAPNAPDLPVYMTYPVLLTPPNSAVDLEYTYERKMGMIDNQTSIPRYVDQAHRLFSTQKHSFFLYGRRERSDFRDVMYLIRGQMQPVWLPTFNDDLTPDGRYYDSSSSIVGREHAIQFFRDGTYSIFNPAPGATLVDPLFDSNVRMSSFLNLKRLGVDDIEFQHYSGLEGLSTVSLIFRDAPDLRTAGSYFKNPFNVTGDPSEAITNPTLDMTATITVSGVPGGL